MTTVEIAVSPGQGLELISTPEWRSLCRQRHNVLVEGSEEWIAGVLLFLAPYLRKPVLWKPSQASYARPTGECGALVLQNVAALSRPEQSELLRWLDESDGGTQVISTNAQQLFPLVGSGLFDEALYYRLNVVLLCVDSLSSADLVAPISLMGGLITPPFDRMQSADDLRLLTQDRWSS